MTTHITHIDIDMDGMPAPTPEIEQERRVAIFDLLEENTFALPARDDRTAPAGPYHLTLAIRDKRLVFDVNTEDGQDAAEFHLSLSPFRQTVKDYWQICGKLLRRGQDHATLQDRGDRHGPPRHPQRGRAHPARPARGQGRGRHRHRATPLHPQFASCISGPEGRGGDRPSFPSPCSTVATTTRRALPWPKG